MLVRATRFSELDFPKLMEIYAEGNRENGEFFYPDLSREQQLAHVEQDFERYLREEFFSVDGAEYWVLREQGRDLSALRMEPFADGLLLEALETRPDARRQGFASRLIRAVTKKYGNRKIYSHISKRNLASRKTHEGCGFRKWADYARLIDGTVSTRADTYLWTGKIDD